MRFERELHLNYQDSTDYSVSVNDAVDGEFEDYLRSKGVKEILAELAEDPKTFTELENMIDVSPTTLSRRLDDGIMLGLLEETIIRQATLNDEINKKKVYQFSSDYEHWQDHILETNLVKLVKQQRGIKEQAEQTYDGILESWTKELD
jgi:DNA-binding transcriptional ArsR family regulator